MRNIIFAAIVSLALLSLRGCASQSKPTVETASVTVSVEEMAPIVLEEAQLGPGDVFEITVWRNGDLDRTVQIGTTGAISYPLIGTLNVGGLSIFEVRDKVAEGLSEYLVDPQVGINVISYESMKIFVLGEVVRPGVFQNPNGMSALEAVSTAGGFTLDAATDEVILVRGGPDDPVLTTLNLSDALKKADSSQNVMLVAGDALYVPASAIAGTERFVRRLDNILRFIVRLETGVILEPGVEKVFEGEDVTRGIVLSP